MLSKWGQLYTDLEKEWRGEGAVTENVFLSVQGMLGYRGGSGW